MFKKMFLVLAICGIAIASAKTYHITLADTYTVGSQTLKPGDYDLAVNGTTAVLEDPDHHVQINGTAQTEAEKHNETAVLSEKEGGRDRITGIQIGGSHLQVHFN